jgi:hypothetical protein
VKGSIIVITKFERNKASSEKGHSRAYFLRCS